MGIMNKRTLAICVSAVALFGTAPVYAIQDAPAREAVHVEAPDYPRGAERRGVEGYVVVSYSIAANGDVVEPAIAEAQPEGIFDRAALRAVESWRFNEVDVQTDGHRTRLNFQLGG